MRELVAAMARDPRNAGWESWLATLSAAISDEEAWLRAIEALDLEDQFVLIDALKSDKSIYSDALQILTARCANAITDEEVRSFLLNDAGEASDRLGNLLQQQHDQLLALIGSATDRRESGFDLAAEVIRLERKLQLLRSSEVGESFEAMQKLDVEIHRLEAFQRSLERYDADSRGAYRDALQIETEQLAQRRAEVEQTVASAIGERDTIQRELDESEQRLTELQRETEDSRARVAGLTAEIATASGALSDVRAESMGLASQLSALTAEQDDQRRQLAEEARRLDELRSSPTARSNQELMQLVEQVYALLPADIGEVQFGS